MNYTRSLISLICLFLVFTIGNSCKDSATTKKEETEAKPDPNVEPEADSLTVSDFIKEMRKSNAVVVDLSFPEEFEQGHIEGAININFFDPNFKSTLTELDKSKTYLLYTNNRSRTRRTGIYMKQNGFNKVYTLIGGFNAYKEYMKK